MKGAALTTFAVLCCLVAATSCQKGSSPALAVVRGNNVFSADLYKELTKTPGNAFFSPFSVQAVLALAWLGAGGETASQIAATLHLPQNRLQVEAGFKALMGHLQNSSGNITLDIANKIYAQKGFGILSHFQSSAKEAFFSEVQEVDFTQNTEMARNTINQWVEEKTSNRIKNLIAEDILSPNTVMVLVNAIYFKGKWLREFNKERTLMKPFHVNSTTFKHVQMMRRTSSYKYSEIPELDAKALQLHYVDKKISMLVLLPNKIEGLPELEAKLKGIDLGRIVKSSFNRKVKVQLPKFKLEQTMDLNSVLQQLGITAMFENSADFRDLASTPIKVSDVVQKSFLDVSEDGTEAAAATAGVSTRSFMEPLPQVQFEANHPFIFFIMDKASGAILFVGRFVTPQ